MRATLSLTYDQMNIDENDVRKEKKRKITFNTTMDISKSVEAKEMELSLEESVQLAQTSSNQLMTSSVAKIKTDLHRLSQPSAINIKFLSKNPYLIQQQFADSYEWTQVMDDGNRGPKQDLNILENPGSETIVKAQLETNCNINRATLNDNCFFDIDS
ncbi:hypothetical protein F8M41_014279 [Gigaspora margarita]|uniref:Uncharacterized protein n=1 Tax=Gigaspora margarita TaxID=4874 RepID=A0A8H3WXM4_GIGMA|nr:hypothetical protein F8M41_014279 [Gigaspora margarita]